MKEAVLQCSQLYFPRVIKSAPRCSGIVGAVMKEAVSARVTIFTTLFCSRNEVIHNLTLLTQSSYFPAVAVLPKTARLVMKEAVPRRRKCGQWAERTGTAELRRRFPLWELLNLHRIRSASGKFRSSPVLVCLYIQFKQT